MDRYCRQAPGWGNDLSVPPTGPHGPQSTGGGRYVTETADNKQRGDNGKFQKVTVKKSFSSEGKLTPFFNFVTMLTAVAYGKNYLYGANWM